MKILRTYQFHAVEAMYIDEVDGNLRVVIGEPKNRNLKNILRESL